jgi:hypothetical protein
LVAGSDSDNGGGDRMESAGMHHCGMLSFTNHFIGKMPVAPARSVAVSEESSNVARAQHQGLRRGGRGRCGE